MAWTLEGHATAPAPDLAHGSTFAYAVNAASTLLVIGGTSNVTGVTPTITYDGQSFTWVTLDDVIDSWQVCLGYLLNPPTGTHNFVNPASTGDGTYFIADYSGITGVTATATNSQLTGTNLTTSLTAAAGGLAVAAASTAHLSTSFVTPTSNMTLLGQDQSFLSCGMYDSTSPTSAGMFGAVTETSQSDRQYTAVATFATGGAASNNASLSETFADFTLAGTARVPISAALSETFADFTLTGTARVPISAALSETFANFTLASSARVPISAALSETFADFTLAGTVIVGTANNAHLNETFADFTLVGTARVPISAALNETFTDFTLNGFVAIAANASLNESFADFELLGTVQNAAVPPRELWGPAPRFQVFSGIGGFPPQIHDGSRTGDRWYALKVGAIAGLLLAGAYMVVRNR